VVALLEEAGGLCAAAQRGLTEASLTDYVAVGKAGSLVQKGVLLAAEMAHGNEVYGTLAVHLRLKGLVPPTTARRTAGPHAP
jgi:hypothetical protein